jgi:hypothetical protein
MRTTFSFITNSLVFFTINVSGQQVKLRYGVGSYYVDSTRANISSYQLDSLLYEIQYYKDLLEEEKRKNFILTNTTRIDTSRYGKDSTIVYFYTGTNTKIAKHSYIYSKTGICRVTVNEDYFTLKGQLFYCDSRWESTCPDKGEFDDTYVFRKRYEYNKNGVLTKAVWEFFISAGHLILRLTNKTGRKVKIDNSEFYSDKFYREKIQAYEFWD